MATRVDAAPWRPARTRIAVALGLGWTRGGSEVRITGWVIHGIRWEFGRDSRHAVWISVVGFAGIALGAADFGASPAGSAAPGCSSAPWSTPSPRSGIHCRRRCLPDDGGQRA